MMKMISPSSFSHHQMMLILFVILITIITISSSSSSTHRHHLFIQAEEESLVHINHIKKFFFFTAVPATNKIENTCHVSPSREMNQTVEDFISDNDLDNKHPETKVIFASASSAGGSSTLALTETLRQFCIDRKIKLPIFASYDDDNIAANDDMKTDQGRDAPLIKISQELFPAVNYNSNKEQQQPSSSAVNFAPAVLIYHESLNMIYIFIDFPDSGESATAIRDDEGLTTCIINAVALLQLIPGSFALHTAPKGRLYKEAYKTVEIEARMTEIIRLSTHDYGVGVITSATARFDDLKKAILKKEHQKFISDEMNDGDLSLEDRLERERVDELRKETELDHELQRIDNDLEKLSPEMMDQFKRRKLKPDRHLQTISGVPAGLLFASYSYYKTMKPEDETGSAEIGVDALFSTKKRTCEDTVDSILGTADHATRAKLRNKLLGNCKYIKGIRQLFLGSVFGAAHSLETPPEPDVDPAWKLSAFSVRQGSRFGRFVSRIIVNQMMNQQEDEDKNLPDGLTRKLQTIRNVTSLMNGVASRLLISGFPNTPKLFSTWDESMKLHTIEFAKFFITLEIRHLLVAHNSVLSSPIIDEDKMKNAAGGNNNNNNNNQENPFTTQTDVEAIEKMRISYGNTPNAVPSVEVALGHSSGFGQNNNNNNKRSLENDDKKEDSSSSTPLAKLPVASPFTREEFLKFRSAVGLQARRLYSALCFGECTLADFENLDKIIEKLFSEAEDSIRKQVISFISTWSEKCISYGSSFDVVRFPPATHTAFTQWKEAFRSGCSSNFDNELGRYKTMIGEVAFDGHSKALVREIDRVIKGFEIENQLALEKFLKPVLQNTNKIGAAQIQAANNNGKTSTPESKIRQKCEEVKSRIGATLKQVIQDEEKNKPGTILWLLLEPQFDTWVQSLKDSIAEYRCNLICKQNEELVQQFMLAEADRQFSIANMHFKEDLIKLPTLTNKLMIIVEKERAARLFDFEKANIEYSDDERRIGKDQLLKLLANEERKWKEKNTEILARQIRPVKQCAMSSLRTQYEEASLLDPTMYVWQFWFRLTFRSIVRKCYTKHIAGSLSHQREHVPDAELSYIIDQWISSDAEYLGLEKAVQKVFWVFLVLVCVMMIGAWYLKKKYLTAPSGARR